MAPSVVAWMFVASALLKLDDFPGWRSSADAWLPVFFPRGIVVVGMPTLEISLALALFFEPPVGLALAGLFLLALAAAVALLIPSAHGRSCGCFGAGDGDEIGWWLVTRNAAGGLLLLVLGATVPAYAWDGATPSALLLSGILVLLAMLGVEFRRFRRAANRASLLESGTPDWRVR